MARYIGPAKPQTPEDRSRGMVYDFDRVRGDSGLSHILGFFDRHGYELVCVTREAADTYLVFFRRPAP